MLKDVLIVWGALIAITLKLNYDVHQIINENDPV